MVGQFWAVERNSGSFEQLKHFWAVDWDGNDVDEGGGRFERSDVA